MSATNNSWLESRIRGLRSARSRSPSVNGRRSRSASPAQSQLPPALPLGRMPSSEALDRSIHNVIPQDDGTEKSKDEIIAKLRKANAALTDKTAEMEATFMNQCNVLASEIVEQVDTIKTKDEAILSFNARLVSIEDKSKEKDTIISKLRTEKSFQKQATTDLKNQLFQMQNDLEEVEFNKSEEITTLKERFAENEKKNAELEKEKNALVFKVDEICMERDRVKQELTERADREEDEPTTSAIEISLKAGSPMRRTTPASPARSTSGDSITTENRQNWVQLEDAREKLQAAETQFHEKQSALASLERKHKDALKQISSLEIDMQKVKSDSIKQINNLKSSLKDRDEVVEAMKKEVSEEMSKAQATLQDYEKRAHATDTERLTMREQVEEFDTQLHGEKLAREKQVNDLKDLLRSRDDIIASLHERLEGYNEDLTKAEQEIDDLTSQVDADKVKQMTSDLEEAGTLLEKERLLTASLAQKYEVICGTVEKLQEETGDFKNAHGNVALLISDKDDQISSLQQELDVFRSSLAKQKESTEMMMNLKLNKISQLEDKIQEQATQIEDASAIEHENPETQTLVQKLRKDIIAIKNEKTKLEAEFEEKISATETEVEDLQKKIDAQLRKINTMEVSYTKEISQLSAEIAILRQTTEEGSVAQDTLHGQEVTMLQAQIAEMHTSHEKEILEARQDVETREDRWTVEREKLQLRISTLELKLSTMSRSKEELEEAKHEIAKLKSLDTQGELQKLRKQLQESKENSLDDDGLHNSASNLEKQTTGKRAYFFSIEKKHKKELAALQQKIADKDIAISAATKSSVAHEQEIMNLQLQISKLRRGPLTVQGVGKSSSFAEKCEIRELQSSITNLLAIKSNMAKEITFLKKELSETKLEKMKALSSSPPRSITKQLNESKLKLQERDGAIATLIKSSITQEQQITALREEIADTRGNVRNVISNSNGPSWQDFTRLQQESEMFAGQIIELDEEIEDLRHRLYEDKIQGDQGTNLAVAVEELGNQVQEQKKLRSADATRHTKTVDELKSDLTEEQGSRRDVENEVKELRDKLKKTSKLARVQDELDEVEDTNHKLQHEVRELRRRMRSALLEAEKVPHLELELSAIQKNMNRMKIDSVNQQSKEVVNNKAQHDLRRALDELDAKEAHLQDVQGELMKLEETIVRCQKRELKLQGELKKLHVVHTETEKELNNKVEVERSNNSRLSEDLEAAELKAQRKVESLKDKMKELENDIDEQNEIISALTNEVKKLRSNSNMDDSDANDIIIALTEEVKKLRSKQMSDQGGESDVIQALSEEVRSLHSALKKKDDEVEARDIEATVRAEVSDELRSMKTQKEFLANEVNRLQSALDSLESDDSRISELKKQLEDAEKGRTQFEKTMISTYERKLNLMQMNKDLTIDGLRKELSQCKETHKEIESDLLSKIRTLESEKMEVEAELMAKMQHKNAKIKFLEQTLSAHEQVSGSMKDEMDHLQNSMENVSVSRRADVEELQEELMSAQAKSNKYERKITSLKMEVEESRLQYRNEVARLEQTIQSMETDTETPMMRDVALERERRVEHDYRQQLKDLMTKVNILQEDNISLKHKTEKDGRQRSSANDKWRNSALQEQVIKLQARLKEYEGDSESVRSSSSRRSNRTENTSRIPRTPSWSYRKDSSSRNSGRDDISTYTETTF